MYIYSLVKKVYYQSTRSIHVYLSVFARQRTQRRILFFGYTAQLYKRRVQPCRMKRIRMYREKRKRKERVLIVARGRKHTREVYICAYAYVCARVSSAAFVCWFVPVIELDRRHFLHWTGFLIYTQGGPKIINCQHYTRILFQWKKNEMCKFIRIGLKFNENLTNLDRSH